MEESAIRFREYQVHSSLVPFIKCIWSQESDHAIFDAGRERILPDSCVELVFHFRDPLRSHFADGTTGLQPDISIRPTSTMSFAKWPGWPQGELFTFPNVAF